MNLDFKDLYSTGLIYKKNDVKRKTYRYLDKNDQQQTIEFYDYFDHLKKHGFKWESQLLSFEVTLATDDKTLVKKVIQSYDPTALAKEISRITTYKNEKSWVETMDYIYDLPSKYTLNQKVKAEDITRFQREVYRYTAFENETNIYKKCAILIGRSIKP